MFDNNNVDVTQGDLYISGHVLFKNHKHTALSLVLSNSFIDNSTVLFYNNSADNGGAL